MESERVMVDFLRAPLGSVERINERVNRPNMLLDAAKQGMFPETTPGPDYYDGEACIEAIEKAMGPADAAAYCRGAAMAALWRAGRKNDLAHDLRNAAWYANRAARLAAELESEGKQATLADLVG